MARTKATKKPAVSKTARKTATKRKATKPAADKKTSKATKVVVKKKVAPTTAIKSALNKSQIMAQIAEHTDLSKKEISAVFESLGNLMLRHLRKGGAGEFTVPSLLKCVVKRKPATKARKGINPFTGEEIMFKAKPARNVIKVRPLKKLKEMAES